MSDKNSIARKNVFDTMARYITKKISLKRPCLIFTTNVRGIRPHEQALLLWFTHEV
ncbi:MAG: hypothetical protein LBJ41_10450 [Treponema sp.]|nr:hypothetical protein [Treponema sp.]